MAKEIVLVSNTISTIIILIIIVACMMVITIQPEYYDSKRLDSHPTLPIPSALTYPAGHDHLLLRIVNCLPQPSHTKY